MMQSKEIVHISRHWSNPEIKVAIHKDGIAIDISLEDFCKAVVAEIPHPSLTMTREKLQANILTSLDTVLNKAKESSLYI